ncbi:MAG TPA: type I DNA topoisomerase [Clostridiaceae bacterium]|nr:type I DNA topoisomerase [Clostridiaceae bacterium]
MSYNLVIVESPGKVKSISKFLGKNYHVQASGGHVRDLPKSDMGVDIENNFAPKYITIRGKGDLIARLKKEAKGADKVYLATDPDREGEAISWHLANLLDIDENSKCRITFNEITKNAVLNALKNPRPIDYNLVNAQQARRILDRIVGYKISPLLWKKVKKGLSAGRVQSVAVRLICDREEEIENFIPEEYWTIVANLTKKDFNGVIKAKFYGIGNNKLDLKNKEQVDEILTKIEKHDFIVSKVKKGERKKSPSPPFITSTLQQEAARKLGFTTKKTMMIAQQLYEGVDVKGHGSIGLITYMRTDSTRISDEALQDVRNFIINKYGNEYIPEKARIFKNKSSAQDAHEAIRPTNISLTPEDPNLKESLNRDQLKLYKLIWERFVACQMSAATFDTLNVDISAGEYIFKVSGSRIKFPGYHVVYKETKDETEMLNNNDNEDYDEEENANLPELSEGEKLKLKNIDSKQNFTQPPPRYTEASLVKALEEKGIGRPSTYAPIISTIITRNYVVRESKLLYPTELGKIVTDILKNHFQDIVDVSFTAKVEAELDKIEEGDKDWIEVLNDFYKGFDITLKKAEQSIGNIEVPDEVSDVVCEKCGRNMVIKKGRYGKFLACPGFPECKNTKPLVDEAGVLCPKCKGKVLIKQSKKGRKYYGCENNPKCDFMSWDKPTGEICPECGSFLVTKYSSTKRENIVKCSNEKCNYTR